MWRKNRGTCKFYGSRTLGPLCSAEEVYEEMAFIAYYFHWSQDEIIKMSHLERKNWCNRISEINKESNGEEEESLAKLMGI